MINLEDFPILQRHMSTLKETSKDNHDGYDYYMTESMMPAVNFDDVKDEYIEQLDLHGKPKSNDALVIGPNDIATFIEFKNGKKDNIVKTDLHKKIVDSLLIFTDLVDKGIRHSRLKMDYILVYNETAESKTDSISATTVQHAKSRDSIGKKLMRLGDSEYIKFGLEIFERFCFRTVHTYTKEEFEAKFIQMISAN